MPGTTPAQGFRIPIQADDPDVVDDMTQLAKAIEKRVVGVYATEADRDTKTIAAGVEEGMIALTKDNDKVWRYDGAAWVEFPVRQAKVGSGPTVPTASDPAYVNGDIFFKV
jgi:hypothetical protein